MTCRITPSLERAEASEQRSESNLSEEEIQSGGVEDLKARLTNTLCPILKVMRVSGIYCGETNFNCLPSCKGPSLYGVLYCSVVVVFLLIEFIKGIVSFFYDDLSGLSTVLYMILCSIWFLVCAGNASVCLFVLPVGRKTPSRFEKFLRRFISKQENLRFSPKRTKKLVLGICLVILFNIICVAISNFLMTRPLVLFKPWTEWTIVKIIHLVLMVFTCASWLFPLLLFCIVCSILAEAFEDFENRMTVALKERTLDINYLRREHVILCETVQLADRTFSPLLLVNFAGFIPLLALLCYQLAKFPSLTSDNIVELAALVFWSIAAMIIISTLLLYASRVNDKVGDTLSIIPITAMFLSSY